MTAKKIKNTNSIGWIVIVMVIILLYAIYFLIYIPQQQALVQKRGFRILKEYAKNVHDKHDYYQKHLENYSIFYAIKSQYKTETVFKKAIQKQLSTSDSILIDEYFEVIKNLVKSIEIDSVNISNGSNSPSFYKDKYKDNLLFNLEHKTFKGKYDEAIDSLHLGEIASSSLQKAKVAKVPISTLMEGLKFDKLFDNIILFTDTFVIHNSNKDVVHDITNTKALLDTISKNQGGAIQMLEIQGVKNHVMILPITFLDKSFYLAGFIPEPDFKRKTRAINSQILSILAGILLLLLIGMPILKIVFINQKERLNKKDAHNATVSLIFGLSLLILLFIGTMKYYVIDRNTSNDRINGISSKLVNNVNSDFKNLYHLCDWVVSDNINDTLGFGQFVRDAIKDSTRYITIPEDKHDGQFPFNEIVLLDSEGKAIKGVTQSAFSNLITLDLSDRLYFQKLTKEGTSWPSPFEGDNFDGYFIESIKSYQTGFKETAISFRLKEPIIVNTGKAQYLAITSHIPSLYDQILPADVAFVVMDETGKVQFHSDQSKNLHENFLIESNNHKVLTGAVKYRTTETAKITYNERQWLAKIVPLEDKPLYHVTLIDLGQTDNKNTRIYLFTFYFMLFTFLCIFAGTQIISRLRLDNKFMKSKSWSFSWLTFQSGKSKEYESLLIIQSLVLCCQLFGLIIVKAPISMLFFHLIFISYSGFVSLLLLGNSKYHSTSFIVLGIAAIFLILFSWSNNYGWVLNVLIAVVLIGLTNFVFKISKSHRILKEYNVKSIYLTYMFIWLSCLAIVPVVSYYLSIKLQEEILSERSKMIHMAHQNLLLANKHHEHEGEEWHKLINGNGIDYLEILDDNHDNERHELINESGIDSQINEDHIHDEEMHGETSKNAIDRSKQHTWIKPINSWLKKDSVNSKLNTNSSLINADSIYFSLSSPLGQDDYLMALLNRKNTNSEWSLNGSSLSYKTAGMKGEIGVNSPNLQKMEKAFGVVKTGINKMNLFEWLLYLFIPILLLLFFVWVTFYFLTEIVLNTVLGKWKIPKTPSWESLLNNDQLKRIVLISFNANNYLEETKTKYSSQIPDFTPKIVLAEDLLVKKSKIEKLIAEKDKTIWVKGLGAHLQQFNNADLIISKLTELNQHATGTVILEVPYDSDFLKEYFEDYIIEYNVNKDEEVQIRSFINGLHHMFKDYYRFTGAIDNKTIQSNFRKLLPLNSAPDNSEEKMLANAHLMKLQYYYIWNNLSSLEKMILFDLADDGMLNFKNKYLINRLYMKGLIEIFPSPRIFTPSFQYFLKYSISQEETILLERKLSKQGMWKNARYMILLILIPLAGFVFISRGISIEKVIGIFTGVLGLFAGGMRLMDSSLFSSSSGSGK